MRNWLFVGLLLTAVTAQAATTPTEDIAEYQSATSTNIKDVAVFLSNPMAKAFAFSTGSQSFSPVAAKGLLHFNIGAGLGVNTTAIDKAAAKAAAKQGGTDITGFTNSLPDSLPLPLASLNAHVGLPGFLIFESTDLGLRYASLNVSSSEISIAIANAGLEFRGNVFEEGLISPVTLTLGLSVDQLKSEFRSRSKDTTLNSISGLYARTGTVKYGFDMDSATMATAVKVAVSRKLLFIRPYAGASFQVLSGDTTISGFQSGSYTSTGPGGTVTSTTKIEGKGTSMAPGLDVRLAGGLEISLFFLYLALGGEYGTVSGGAGGNGQIGLQF